MELSDASYDTTIAAAAVNALPTAALRQDLGTVITAAPYLPKFAALNPLENLKLTKPSFKAF